MPGLIEYFTARKISTWERKGGWDYYNWEGNTPGEKAMVVLNGHSLALDMRLAANAEALLSGKENIMTHRVLALEFLTLYFVICFLLLLLLQLLPLPILPLLLLLLLTFPPLLLSPRSNRVHLRQIVVMPRRAMDSSHELFSPSPVLPPPETATCTCGVGSSCSTKQGWTTLSVESERASAWEPSASCKRDNAR